MTTTQQLHPTAFPTLTKEEVALLEPYASCETFDDGTFVFKVGQDETPMFVVKSGILEILNPHDDNAVIVEHGPGQFTGDIDLVTRRPIIVSARAKGKTNVLRIKNENLRHVLNRIPRISEKLLVAFQQRRDLLAAMGKLGLKVVGYTHCKDTTLMREFLHKNFVPFTFYDILTPEGQKQHTRLGSAQSFPIVECQNGLVLHRPTLQDVAHSAGIWRHCPNQMVDIAIIGAGPAGITAAVYAASEGLSTLVLDRVGPGGQAGGSSKIENFIGFPSGLSGNELATRGILQMLKFGAQLIAPVEVRSILPNENGPGSILPLDCGAQIKARVVLIASGVTWKKLEAKNASRYERAGVYYSCTSVEALLHDNSDVAVVGAGNSAGQAAMYLSECCPSRTVHMIVRSTLGPSMSEYLAQRIRSSKNIKVHEHSQIESVNGGYTIESIDVSTEGKVHQMPASAVFVFIGAEPGTSWLPDTIAKDSKGFLLTGAEVKESGKWPLERRLPCVLETSIPGVIAAGDIRSGTTKRVGFAVGDGALAVTCAHNLLQEQG